MYSTIKQRRFIGIDPDVNKSGVAVYDSETKELTLYNLKFFSLFDLLTQTWKEWREEALIVIEAGWLNKSNWHSVSKGSSAINAQIGQRTGANHETGKKIAEMCEYLELDYDLVKPVKSKVDAKTFSAITGIKSRTNQEQRDAALLVFGKK